MVSTEPGEPSAQSPGVDVDLAEDMLGINVDSSGQLVSGGLARVVGYALMIALSVLATVVLTRHLGVRLFGQYTTALSLALMLGLVTDAGMWSVASHEYAIRSGEDRNRFMSDLLALRVTLTVIGVVLSAAIAVAAGYDSALVLGTAAASLAVVVLVALHTLSLPLSNELKLGTIAVLEVARQAVWVGALVVLCAIGAALLPLLATAVIANLILLPPTLRATRGMSRVRLAIRPRAWRSLLGVTAIFSLATSVGMAYMYTTQILTSLVASPEQSGLFSVSFRVFVVAAGIPSLVGSAALPLLARAARDDRDRLAYVVKRFLEVSFVGGVGVALVISAGSPFAISLLSGSRFHAAGAVLEIQAFAMIATFVTAPCSFALLSLHEHRKLLVTNGLGLTVSIVATIVLASTDGARGAAIATICGETTIASLMLFALVRHRPQYRPSARFILKMALASICAVPIAVVPAIPSVPRAIAAGTVFLVIILATGALPSEIMEILPFSRRGTAV
jgi:O-antigen/teichoic acid export membrane protein